MKVLGGNKLMLILICVLFAGCLNLQAMKGESTNNSSAIASVDKYSYANKSKAIIIHLDLEISIDFITQKISGKATYIIDNSSASNKIYFDTQYLTIDKIFIDKHDTPVSFSLGDYEEYKGRELAITIAPQTKRITIHYSTQEQSTALQWLNPEQTIGKRHPFLYTQSEPNFARSWIPIQDSPGIRITYNATVDVPSGLMAVMSAENPKNKSVNGKYFFKMEQKIPAYLIALAVGDFEFKDIGQRSGVYAEKELLDKAAYEFGELEQMLSIAEGLYGPYRWDRYDLIVLPPSFPFGGMENPRMTFATPTLIAGDRSLVSVIAHELAHSWSGNLVTNSTWNDFWLNEGFTVYFERRIMEELYGVPYTQMLALLGYQDLQAIVKELGPQSADTHLKLKLNGRNPDEALTDIAYEKGSLFLSTIEETVGRKQFDLFLNNYFNSFAFQPMTTERFLDYLNSNLIKGDTLLAHKINIDAWVYGPGIPSNHTEIKSDRFVLVDEEIQRWEQGSALESLQTSEWSTHEWLHFLRHLPATLSQDKMMELDHAYDFSKSGNAEILSAWFLEVIKNNYLSNYDELETFLVHVGRRKFLSPLYREMAKTESNKTKAREIYAKARQNYHSISATTIDSILN